jgi:DpnII restriction endonuclease
VLIETNAYGATGSKQTDVLGNVARIVDQKRHDTDFLLVTDGVTWKDRVNDLRKRVEMQNQGLITRIYTRAMASQFEEDLKELRREHAL